MSDHLTPIPWLDVVLILALVAAQRPAVDERACDRLVARGEAEGDGAEPEAAAPNARSISPASRPVPVDRAERDYAHRDFRRRIFRRAVSASRSPSGWSSPAFQPKPRRPLGLDW